ncbi:MAG: hypothetical protein ABI898_11490 [Sphingomonadales bacterium]
MTLRFPQVLGALLKDRSGLAFMEFAYSLPLVLGIGLGGIEAANLAITRMRISQIGMAVADNAARAGQGSGMALAKMYESDVADVFDAARIQGTTINFKARGKVILSSLQPNSVGGQWIAWQRCYGDKAFTSNYGTAGQGKTGTAFLGMGPTSALVTAPPQNAVMFVEVAYDYKAIVEPFARALQYFGMNVDNQVITYRGAFIVREPRELGDSTDVATTTAEDFGLFQNTPAVTRQVCT